MAQSLANKNRLLEKYVQVVREDGLNTNKNVNIGINSASAALWVSGNISTGGGITAAGTVVGGTTNVINVTGATRTLTAAQSGSLVALNVATTTVTLPTDAPGLTFTFVVQTAATAQKVIIGSASSFFQGWLGVPVSTGTQKLFYGDASTLLSINLNGTTTGGLIGGQFTVTCVAAGLWQCSGNVEGSGTVATPFATS